MLRCSIVPYEGTQPYIFVSYAHRDSEQVYPVLEELSRRGYRLWYDDGIAPGSEWPENIAQHLNGCALTLAFVSPNSIASANCRREITFALSKQKPFLAILLQPTEMSPGMEMQLSAQQCIMKYSYTDEESFFRKICSCPDLEPCLAPPVPVVNGDAPAPAAPAPKSVPAPAPEPAPAPAPQEPRKKSKEKQPLSPEKKKKRMIIAGICAAVLLLLILIPIFNSVKLTDDKTVSKNETYVSLHDEVITYRMIKQLNKLKDLNQLYLTDCSFQAGVLEDLELTGLRYLTMTSCAGVDNLEFLTRSPELTSILLDDCKLTDSVLPRLTQSSLREIAVINSPKVTSLDFLIATTPMVVNISGTGVTSLEGICGEKLETLAFNNTAISDITCLAGFESLISVVANHTGVTDISPLAGLENLTRLEFSGCALATPTEVFACLRLQHLILENTGLSSLSAFANTTLLQTAGLSGNPLEDISLLEANSATLRHLTLANAPLTQEDLAFLSQCGKLQHLVLDGIALQNLNFLSAPELYYLSAADCALEDISALSASTNLSTIVLNRNQITDLSPLKSITTTGYVVLDLNCNPITDASGLPLINYRALGLLCEGLDLATLPADIKGSVIFVYYTDALADAVKPLKAFTRCCLGNCPGDKQLEVERLLGSFNLRLLETKEDIRKAAEEFQQNYDYLTK